MKKILVLATVLLAFAMIFAACESKDDIEGTKEETAGVTDPATDAPVEESIGEPEIPTQEPTEETTQDTPIFDDTNAPTEAPTREPDVPTEAPTEEPAVPLHIVEPDFLANYAAQTGNGICNNDLGTTQILSEAGRSFFRLTSGGGDPYIAFIEGQKNLRIGRYMAISYRTNSSKNGQFFMGSGGNWSGSGDQFLQDWQEDGNWNLAIIDLDNVGLTALTDYVLNYARLDFFTEAGAAGDYFDVEYIAFFDSAKAAGKYDLNKHNVPMWNEHKSVVTHQSFDELTMYYKGTAGKAVFAPGQSEAWNFVFNNTDGAADMLRYWGWIGVKGEFGQLGYQINGGAPVYNDIWTHPTGQDVIDAAIAAGADTASRMQVMIPLAGLEDENIVRVLYKSEEGIEVCLNEFTVIMAMGVTYYENYTVPYDKWVITGHNPQLNDSSNGMVAAGGVEYGALLHQGSIYLGELDLSKYDSVIVTWGCDNSQITVDHYNKNPQNRIMLLNSVMDGVMSPADETVIAGSTYQLRGWAVTAFEIDLTGINYKGPVYVAIDSLPGTFALISSVEFIGGEVNHSQPVKPEIPDKPSTPNPPVGEKLVIPQDQWVISGHMTQIVTPDHATHGGMIAAGGVESAALLHQGSIALGKIDLSKYSKAVIYWGSDNGSGTQGLYAENAHNRFALVSADKNAQMSPDEDTVIAASTYQLHGWSIAPLTINLTNVNYNGPVFLTHDSLPGGFALIYSIEFIP